VKVLNNAFDIFSFKITKTTESYKLLHQAQGEDAIGCTQVFDWFCRFIPFAYTNGRDTYQLARLIVYTYSCETGWAVHIFAFSSSFLPVDGIDMSYRFKARRIASLELCINILIVSVFRL
jgi:hypothetical protein